MLFDALKNPLFPLEGKAEEFRLTGADHLRLATLPLWSIEPPPVRHDDDASVAVILHGPPNSGKTNFSIHHLKALMSQAMIDMLVPISYDEDTLHPGSGALFNIPAYWAVYAKQLERVRRGQMPDMEEIGQIYRAYRSDSQRVRSFTMNLAVAEKRPLLIDTTSSGMGTVYMIKNLRQAEYKNIYIISCVSPLDTAVARSEDRLRLVEPEEVFTKRIGAFDMFEKLVPLVDRFDLLNNPVNGKEAAFVLSAQQGRYTSVNGQEIRRIQEYLQFERAFCQRHYEGYKHADKLAVSAKNFSAQLSLALG